MALKDWSLFAAGMCFWEAVVHGSLFASNATPKVFGFKMTSRFNLNQAIIAGALALIFGALAWTLRDRRNNRVKVQREEVVAPA